MRPSPKSNITPISAFLIPAALLLVTTLVLSSCAPVNDTPSDSELPRSMVTIEQESLEAELPLDGNAKPKFSPDNPYSPNAADPIGGFAIDLQFTEISKELYFDANPEYASGSVLDSVCAGAVASEYANILGCFSFPPQKIHIYDITDPRMAAAEPVIAAHELLHAVWYFDMNGKERKRIATLLENYFNSLPSIHYLRERLESYADTPDVISTELHSILGTESGNLTPELEAHYKKYFKDRSVIVELAGASFGYLYKLGLENEKTAKLINALRKSSATQRAELDVISTNLSARITSLNTLLSNGYYNNNKAGEESARQSVEKERVAQKSALDSFTKTTAELNVIIVEHNKSIELLNDLNDAIETK